MFSYALASYMYITKLQALSFVAGDGSVSCGIVSPPALPGDCHVVRSSSSSPTFFLLKKPNFV